MLEILKFLRDKGHKVSIFNFLTNEPYRKWMFENSLNRENSQDITKEANTCRAIYDGVNISQILLPYGQHDVQKEASSILKIVVSQIQDKKIDFAWTMEDCGITLLAAFLLKIPGAHFFRSLSYVKSFPDDPFVGQILKKRPSFAVSRFIKDNVKQLLDADPIVWHPLLDPKRTTAEDSKTRSGIGFYSGGKHKGDQIVNKIIEKMPETPFLVAGRNYYRPSKILPSNLNYLNDITDVKKLYGQVKMILVPSIVGEAFSRIVIESSLNGLPVIANNVGGIPEALGGSGILIDIDLNQEIDFCKMADKYIVQIKKLLKDGNEYETFRQKAFARGKEYELEQQKTSQEIYEKYLKG